MNVQKISLIQEGIGEVVMDISYKFCQQFLMFLDGSGQVWDSYTHLELVKLGRYQGQVLLMLSPQICDSVFLQKNRLHKVSIYIGLFQNTIYTYFLSLKYYNHFTCWIIFLCNLRITSDDFRPEQVSSFCTFVSFLFPECCWWCFCSFCRERDKLQRMKWDVHNNSHLQNIRFLSSN